MAFLFKTKKSPSEIVKSIQKNLGEMVDEKNDEKGVKKVLLITKGPRKTHLMSILCPRNLVTSWYCDSPPL